MTKQALASMSGALRRQCSALLALRSKANLDEIATRYEMGTIVLSIDEDAKGTYGERAVERAAQVLGCSDATLYRYAAVARLWSASGVRELSERTDRAGEAISWSHLAELARVPKTWRAWLDLALDGCWSARRLGRELDAEARDRAASKTAAEDTTRAALLEALKRAQDWNTQVNTFGAALDRLARSKQRPPEIEELLARALDVFGDAHRKTGDVVARVREMATRSPARGVNLEN